VSKNGVRVEGVPSARFGCGRDGWGVYGGWDAEGGVFRAWVDPLGMWPLFYSIDGDTVRISDSLCALVRDMPAPRRLDEEAMSVFFSLGYFLGNDTPFSGVRALGLGGRLEVDGNGARVTEEPPTRSDAAISDRREAIEEYVRLLRQAVHRSLERVGPARAIFLSGGRDSRLIFLMLRSLNASPEICVTLGSGTSTGSDVDVASRLCARLGVAHQFAETRDPDYQAIVASTEATHLCADENGWIAPASGYLAGLTDVAYDGIAGDVLAGGLFLNERLVDACERRDWAGATGVVLERTRLGKRLRARAEGWLGVEAPVGIAKRRIEEALAAQDNEASPGSMFYFRSRTRREISTIPFGIERQIGRVGTPFLDPDFVRFASAVPARWRLDKSFHTEAVHWAFPEVSDVPFATVRNRHGKATAYIESYARAALGAISAAGVIDAAGLLPFRRNIAWMAYLISLKRLAIGVGEHIRE
jgi:hypothetical protein